MRRGQPLCSKSVYLREGGRKNKASYISVCAWFTSAYLCQLGSVISFRGWALNLWCFSSLYLTVTKPRPQTRVPSLPIEAPLLSRQLNWDLFAMKTLLEDNQVEERDLRPARDVKHLEEQLFHPKSKPTCLVSWPVPQPVRQRLGAISGYRGLQQLRLRPPYNPAMCPHSKVCPIMAPRRWCRGLWALFWPTPPCRSRAPSGKQNPNAGVPVGGGGAHTPLRLLPFDTAEPGRPRGTFTLGGMKDGTVARVSLQCALIYALTWLQPS